MPLLGEAERPRARLAPRRLGQAPAQSSTTPWCAFPPVLHSATCTTSTAFALRCCLLCSGCAASDLRLPPHALSARVPVTGRRHSSPAGARHEHERPGRRLRCARRAGRARHRSRGAAHAISHHRPPSRLHAGRHACRTRARTLTRCPACVPPRRTLILSWPWRCRCPWRRRPSPRPRRPPAELRRRQRRCRTRRSSTTCSPRCRCALLRFGKWEADAADAPALCTALPALL